MDIVYCRHDPEINKSAQNKTYEKNNRERIVKTLVDGEGDINSCRAEYIFGDTQIY